MMAQDRPWPHAAHHADAEQKHEMVCAWCCLIHAGPNCEAAGASWPTLGVRTRGRRRAGKTRAGGTAMLHCSRCRSSVSRSSEVVMLRGACLCTGSSRQLLDLSLASGRREALAPREVGALHVRLHMAKNRQLAFRGCLCRLAAAWLTVPPQAGLAHVQCRRLLNLTFLLMSARKPWPCPTACLAAVLAHILLTCRALANIAGQHAQHACACTLCLQRRWPSLWKTSRARL